MIIGRFSNIADFPFRQRPGSDPLAGEFYIGSADWMFRTHRRVEAAAPVEDRAARERLWEILDICLQTAGRRGRCDPMVVTFAASRRKKK